MAQGNEQTGGEHVLTPRAYSLLRHAAGRVASKDVPRGPAAIALLLSEPVPLTLACEVLAELGGSARFETADGLLEERVPGSDRARRWIWDRLKRLNLVFEFQRVGAPSPYITLTEECAEHVARAVLGVSLPRHAPNADTPPSKLADADVRLRDAIALVGALAHQPVRFTLSAGPHRGSLKKLTTSLGIDLEAAAAIIDRAGQFEILGARGDCYSPLANVLRERHERLVPRGDVDPVVARIKTREWTSAVIPFRMLRRHRYDEGFLGHKAPAALPDSGAIRRAIEADARLEWLVVDGYYFVRRRSLDTTTASTGDGHVTPNFQVMLGPAATPDVTISVALGAECVRIDRVVTFKLTPASVAGAIRCGSSVDELIAALRLVGRAPLPENVEHMVREWGAASVPARIRTVWCLEVPPSAVPRLRELLGPDVLATPSPGMLLVDRQVERDRLYAAFEAAGVVRSDVVPLHDSYGDLYDEDWEHPSDAVSAPLVDTPWEPALTYETPPDRAFVERVDAFDDKARAEFDAKYGAPPTVTSRLAAPAANDPLGEALSAVHRVVLADANTFASRLRGPQRRDALAAISNPAAWFPWSLFTPPFRERCVLQSESLVILVKQACSIADQAVLAPEGWAVVAAAIVAPDVDTRLRLGANSDVARAYSDLVRRYHERSTREAAATSSRTDVPSGSRATTNAGFREPDDFASAFETAKRMGWRVAIYRHTQPDEAFVIEPERVDRTGGDVRLLGYDVEADRGRSFPIGGIARLVILGVGPSPQRGGLG